MFFRCFFFYPKTGYLTSPDPASLLRKKPPLQSERLSIPSTAFGTQPRGKCPNSAFGVGVLIVLGFVGLGGWGLCFCGVISCFCFWCSNILSLGVCV